MFHILKAGRYSAVCDFSGDFSGITLLLARKAGVGKRIASYRGWLPLYRQDPLRKAYAGFMRGMVRSQATNILSNSKACFELFFPNYWENDARFKVVYNGIPIEPYSQPVDADGLRNKLGIASDKVIIGHLGRHDKAKNHNTILEVAKRFQDAGREDIVFLFIGHGIPEGIGPISQQLGLNNVVCSPARIDIPDILRILDAFIFPSITEGQPNALLEVMFEGIPFVSSNIPSIKECVHYDAYDWLVDPFDVEGAFKRVALMIDNLERFKLKAAKMQPWIRKRHDATRCFGQLAECLRSVRP
jgi:glycosyltransferase involved in cell wall biosynthesis